MDESMTGFFVCGRFKGIMTRYIRGNWRMWKRCAADVKWGNFKGYSFVIRMVIQCLWGKRVDI